MAVFTGPKHRTHSGSGKSENETEKFIQFFSFPASRCAASREALRPVPIAVVDITLN